jgi:nitrate reductase assembly molybdenum cofactor insertion protein NarJ
VTVDPLHHYEPLAALFEYPEVDYPARVRRALAAVASGHPRAAARLQAFADALPPGPAALSPDGLIEMQEVFTRSFDVQAITTLSVGYVMFGDDYKRGQLLVNLGREHRDAGVDCGRELADHLPNVLRLLARWPDQELAAELVEEIVRPAVANMIVEFGPERMAQRTRLYAKHFKTVIASSGKRATIFRAPLTALAEVLDQDFPCREPERLQQGSDFLRALDRELNIEANQGRPAPAGRLS